MLTVIEKLLVLGPEPKKMERHADNCFHVIFDTTYDMCDCGKKHADSAISRYYESRAVLTASR